MIRRFASADVARIAHLQPEGWDDITAFFRFYVDSDFCRPLKIEDGEGILGVGSLILHAETAWLAHIIVRPEHRRRGVGAEITRELISTAERHGRTTQLLIATAMGAPLYERLGFQRSCDYRFYDAREPVSDPVPSQVRPVEPSDAGGICALDRRVTGEDRRLLLADSGWRGWIVHDPGQGGKIRGYFLAKLGEGTVVAEDAEAGTTLMRVRLASTGVRPVLPAGNDAAHELLRQAGFNVQSSAARMVRGGADPLDQRAIFNRIGGHVG
jgi:GNAT superfamily N-acetyltransferase